MSVSQRHASTMGVMYSRQSRSPLVYIDAARVHLPSSLAHVREYPTIARCQLRGNESFVVTALYRGWSPEAWRSIFSQSS